MIRAYWKLDFLCKKDTFDPFKHWFKAIPLQVEQTTWRAFQLINWEKTPGAFDPTTEENTTSEAAAFTMQRKSYSRGVFVLFG